jgi:hypothetical protein
MLIYISWALYFGYGENTLFSSNSGHPAKRRREEKLVIRLEKETGLELRILLGV